MVNQGLQCRWLGFVGVAMHGDIKSYCYLIDQLLLPQRRTLKFSKFADFR